MKDVTVDNSEEDLDSVEQHVGVLKLELEKGRLDLPKIQDRMDRTFHSRREFILNPANKLAAILERFPALTLDTEVRLNLSIQFI